MRKWFNSILYGRPGSPEDPQTGVTRNVQLLLTNNGAVHTQIGDSTRGSVFIDFPDNPYDETDGPMLGTLGFNYIFDGVDAWNRETGNTAVAALASAARTASVNSTDLTNINCRGAHFAVDVSSITDTPSIVVTIQGKDELSGIYYDLLSSNAITAVGTTILKIYPGINSIPNGATPDILPRTYRASVANADADSITYSVGVSLVV